MQTTYNQRNPAVKRLMREAAELCDPTELFFAQPLEDNLFEWHFTVRGPPDTDFANGVYHGRILLPTEYPMKPPSIMILTPNGRFELNKKICLSISGYHPESWQPSWSIRTALLAIIGFMPTPGAGAIGALDYSAEERKILAQKSLDWKCPTCRVKLADVLPPLTDASLTTTAEARELASQISFKDASDRKTTASLTNDALAASLTDGSVNTLENDVIVEDVEDSSSVETQPVRDASSETNVRQRPVRPPVADHRQSESPGNVEPGSGTMSFAILLVAITLAVLLFRRLYMMNEWRFYSESG